MQCSLDAKAYHKVPEAPPDCHVIVCKARQARLGCHSIGHKTTANSRDERLLYLHAIQRPNQVWRHCGWIIISSH